MAVARKEQLLDIGARLAAKHGLGNVTRRMVAGEAKVSEALVSSYVGNVDEARAFYKARAKRLGLKLPDAATEAQLGLALRAHGPRDNGKRKRSTKEVKAIKRKVRGNPTGTGKQGPIHIGKPAPKRSAARQPVLPPLIPAE